MKITTRKRKERRLLELIKNAADQSSDGILITNAKLNYHSQKILYVNKQFYALTGYKYPELIGKNIHRLLGSKTNPKIIARLRRNLSHGENFLGRMVNYRKDGSEFYMEWDISPVSAYEGKTTHFFSIVRDVSEQITTENGKQERIGIVGHELKTPLTSLKGLVAILKKHMVEENYSNKKKNIEYLALMESEVERLIGLTEELLNTTRRKTIGVRPDKQPCDLDCIIRQVIKNVKIAYNTHKIKRRGKIGTLVSCDKDRIMQVVTNLLTNAIKYSPNADQVFMTIERENNHAIIKIQDFGMGIPKEKQEKIFERFYRATDKNQSVSTGLGLYIASEIVRNHDGKIWVESTEGKGSVFSFSLPL